MRPFLTILRFSMLVILSASSGYAATITGIVKGPDGAPFKGAFVIAQNSSNRMSVTALSDKNGRYRIPDLPAASYDLRIRAVGYKADPHNGVNLTASQNTSYDWALQQGVVRWSDLNLYQGKQLLPKTKAHIPVLDRLLAIAG